MRSFAVLVMGCMALHPSCAKALDSGAAEIIRMEQTWSNAVVAHHPEIVAAILADDYIGIDGRGIVTSKTDEIAEARRSIDAGAPVLAREELSDIRVRLYETAAVLTALNTATFNQNDTIKVIRYRRTTVYVRRDGHWQCVSFHGSRVSG